MGNNGLVPPYNAEAEAAVLGSVLLDNSVWGNIFASLNSDDFYLEKNRKVFDGMYSLFEEGIPVDHITLGNKLIEQGSIQKIGGPLYLANLTDNVSAPSNAMHYANIIHEASSIRNLIYSAQEVVSEGYKANGLDYLSPSVDKLVAAAQALGKRRMPDSLLALGDKVLENYRLVADGYRGIELPWPSLDLMTAGLWPKTITMFVARPSVGKTMVAIIIARHAWMNGKRVLIVSPEMTKVEMAERFFVISSGVSYHNVVTGQLPTISENNLRVSVEELRDKYGLWIIDSDDDLSLRGIDAAIRACNPHLVGIDSMYDLNIKGDRRERIIAAMDWGKRNCKQHGYALVGFGQQNRAAELSEKKGGGARLGTIALADEIAQDAHTVFALEQTKDDKDDKILKFVPLKLRRGKYKKPKIKSNWDFDRNNYSEILDDEDDEYGNGDIPF